MANARIDLGLYGKDSDLKAKLDGAKQSLADLRELGKDIGLGLNDDKFKVQLLDADRKLDELDRKTSKPSIRLEGADRAILDIAKVGLAMDELGRKKDKLSESSGSGSIFSKISRLFPSGNGSGPESASGESGGMEALLPVLGLGGGLAAALLPSILGFGVGTGVGALGAYGAYKVNPKPFTGLLSQLEKEFTGSLTGNLQMSGRSGNRVGGTTSIAGTSFVAGMVDILKQLGDEAKSVGPELGDMFRASLPFISAFAGTLGPIAKSLMPQFTSTMNEMVKSGALKEMALGLTEIVTDGLVPMLKVMGPGLKDSAVVFRATILSIDGVIVGLGALAMVIARSLDIMGHATEDAGKAFYDIGRVIGALLTGNWTALGHAVAAMGDNFRNFFASLADELDVGFIKLSDFGHNVASIFDDIRHDVAAAWSATWRDIYSALKQGVEQDINFVKVGLLDALVNDLKWLGGQFMSLGKQAISDLWSGLKSGASSITGWLSGFAKGVIGVLKKVFGIFSPSREFFDIGSALMHGLSLGIQSKANSVSSALGNVSGGVKRWASTVQEALKLNNLPLSLTSRVLYQMQTESSGNPMAINLTDSNAAAGDPSRGLMQVIGTTFSAYHVPGTSMDIYNPLANIAAAINYARHRYGPTLMDGGMGIGSGHGYALGGIIDEPIVGMGLRTGMHYTLGENGPETVIPGRHSYAAGGGDTYVSINMPYGFVGNANETALAIQKLLRKYKNRGGRADLGFG